MACLPVLATQAHKAAREAAATRQDLAAAVERAERYKAGMLEQQGEAAAAREAEQRLQQQLAGEQRRTEKVRPRSGGGLCLADVLRALPNLHSPAPFS